MAKKVVATLKTGESHSYTKVIRFVRSKKTGAYTFQEEIVNRDHVKDFFAGKK